MTPPRAWSLVAPPGWNRVRLGSTRRADVAALVERRFAGLPRDSTGPYARELERTVLEQADAAARTGATDLYLFAERAADLPLTASFTVSPVHLGADAEDLSASDWGDVLRERGEDGAVVDLGGVPALRTSGSARAGRDQVLSALGVDPAAVPAQADEPDGVDSERVDYLVPVPGAPGDALLLVFGTPAGPLAPALVEVFDAVASTLCFHDTVPTRSPA